MRDVRDRPERAIVPDNCALNGIIGCQKKADEIRVAVVRGQVAVWTCPSLILETIAGSAIDPVTARSKLAFLHVVSGEHTLRTTGSLLEWEGKHGHFPYGSDRFMSRSEADDVYSQCLSVCDAGGRVPDLENGSIRELRQIIHEEKEKGRATFIGAKDTARQAVIRAFQASEEADDADPSDVQSMTGSDGLVDFDALGQHMVSMDLNAFAGWVSRMVEQTGFGRTATAQDLPSLPYTTSAAGYLVAQIASNYMTGRNWARNDTYDAQYCVAAAQTRALVTLDADLRTICSRMPYRPFGLADINDIGALLTG